jgi:nanoRNase/pAp phosphatase (c-di-AMP/oligoRNAs hydrolase)
MKTDIGTIAEKNRIIGNIIGEIITKRSFLITGHQNPDEDCIASMVAFALLVNKFSKKAVICVDNDIHEHFQYLLDICRYNSIAVRKCAGNQSLEFDDVVVCDTPKPDMVVDNPNIRKLMKRPDKVVIEIDHHLESDSDYIGDPGYQLVAEASSAAELVGLIILKINDRPHIIREFQIEDLLSRNIVLSVLTGIIGDSKMGSFLKTRREKRFYRIFSSLFDELLSTKTVKTTNFSNMEEVFNEIGRLSRKEAASFEYLMGIRDFTPHIGYVYLPRDKMKALSEQFDRDTVVQVARSLADQLAEESGYISLVGYEESPDQSEFVQYRMRRSQDFKDIDLRDILSEFGISNGGGHEGAVGFRIPYDKAPEIKTFLQKVEKRFFPVSQKK